MAMKPKKSHETTPGKSRDYVRSYIGSEPRYEVPTKAEAAKRAKKESRQYSPAPMNAAAKAKAAARGKATAAKTKPKSTIQQITKRFGITAREARDIATAFGTSLRDQEQNVRRAAMGVKPTGKNVGKNLRTQIKEVGSAIKSGKKGTSSDMYNKSGAYKSGTKRK